MSSFIEINHLQPESHLIEQAARVLKKGGVIGYPTETIYGIGCNAFDVKAVERIYQLKNRDRSKAMIIIAGDMVQVHELVQVIPEAAEKLIENFWPGPLTLILQASSRFEDFPFSKSRTIAVRIPDCSICLELLKETGFPIVSTSANRSNEPAATTAEEVKEAFGDQLDLIINGGATPDNLPSTLVDFTRTPARIVREGAISSLEIYTVLDFDEPHSVSNPPVKN
ncbi:MAG: threonylcarbamoyl-AMP synthase [Calditrichaeota bacterium]|nr:MAG: threonylcarbamoyl-AMP synthase [Calditrichota bacterium]